MAKPVEVTDGSFETMVIKAEKPTVVDFWAAWCGPCRAIAPVLDELAEEFDGSVQFTKLNTDENQTTPQKYGIMGIPTVILFKDGKEVQRITGAYPKGHFQKMIAAAVPAEA